MEKIIIDAGHGGSDAGAVYNGRQEKNDTLRLALAVGKILSDHGIDVSYTRTTDIYHSPSEKAMIGNNAGADLFISIHRNAAQTPNTGTGIETLVYADQGIAAQLARNINKELETTGYRNRGVIERPELTVLKRTVMPAVLVEAGFLNNTSDNQFFDQRFNQIAQAIADGILATVDAEKPKPQKLYRVQVGAYKNSDYANQLANRLKSDGFQAFIAYRDGYYRVQAGAFTNLDNAVSMERQLRKAGYDTFITSS